MKPVFLDFEQPIAELTNKIDEPRFVQDESAVDISDEIHRLQKKSNDLTKSIFSKLTPAQVSQVSRHPRRPILWITLMRCLLILKSRTATAILPTIMRLSADWRVSTDKA